VIHPVLLKLVHNLFVGLGFTLLHGLPNTLFNSCIKSLVAGRHR
jgi:hypothetical protein